MRSRTAGHSTEEMIAQDFVLNGWRYLDRRDFPPLNHRIEFAYDERRGRFDKWYGEFASYPPEMFEGIKGWWWRCAID